MFERIANSVRNKLLLLIVAVTFIALMMSGASLLWYEAQTYQQRLVQDLETQADILGRSSSAAIAFGDKRVANENLELLRARPEIRAASLYSEQGILFASFVRKEEAEVPASLKNKDSLDIRGERISVVKPIVEGNSVRGAVYIRATYGLAGRISSYAAILAVVMVLSLVAAVTIGVWLQTRITQPIAAMARTAHEVVATRDFSLRVSKTTSDEIGYLVDAFNAMLAEIGARSEALALADQMKDQFLATLAHELRNPLAPLSNALHILRTARDRPDLTESAHNMMERQLRQMVRLVDDLLDVSRITTGKLILHKENVSLHAILDNAIEVARPLIDLRNHRLVVNLPEEEIRLDADPARLAQVFSNLLNNAAKYTDERGCIELDVRLDHDAVLVRIADNGIGISPDLLSKIFQMFTQADNSIERQVQSGLGVGLALSKRLVELHGGAIEAESAGLGRGSRFSVSLPVCREMVLRITTCPAAKGQATGYRVLVIDDNVDFANSLAVILRELGNDVSVAHDGVAGLREAQRSAHDMAFVDIGLPGLNGYDVVRRLRERADTSAMVLVAVTGWGQEADVARALGAGFDRHIVKPLDAAQLQNIFELVATKRRTDKAMC